MMFILRTRNLP